jgi:hypothetical protein
MAKELYYEIEVKIPSKCIIKTTSKNGNFKYVYYLIRAYRDPIKKQNRNDRVCIGRSINSKLMNPNGKYYELFPNEVKPEIAKINLNKPINILSFGNYYLFDNIIETLKIKSLLERANLDTKVVLPLAQFILDESATMNKADRYFKANCSYCSSSLISQRTSEVFQSISDDEIHRFLSLWINSQQEEDCIAVDSTNIYSHSKNITLLDFGYNKEDNGLRQLHLVMAYGLNSELPICYELTDGSLTDKASFKNIRDRFYKKGLNIKRWVLDGGYFYKLHIESFKDNFEEFIIPIPKNDAILKRTILEKAGTFENYSSRVNLNAYKKSDNDNTYGVVLPYNDDYNMLLYVSDYRKSTEITEFYKKIDLKLNQLELLSAQEYLSHQDIEVLGNLKDFFNFEVIEVGDYLKLSSYSTNNLNIENHVKTLGYFAFMTNSKNETKESGLLWYNKRVKVEGAFDNLLNRISLRRLGTHSDITTNAKIFIGFISLIVKTFMDYKFRDYKLMYDTLSSSKKAKYVNLDNMSTLDLLDELALIQLFNYNGYHNTLKDTITKKQRIILELFNLSETKLMKSLEQHHTFYLRTKDE